MKWHPIELYYKGEYDWALVQFKQKGSNFYPLPMVAEYSKKTRSWHLQSHGYSDNSFMSKKEYEEHLNEHYDAVAFCLWQDYQASMKIDKKYKIVYPDKVTKEHRKLKYHYTQNLHDFINWNKGAWVLWNYYFPIKIYDNSTNKLLFTINSVDDIEKAKKVKI